MHPAQAYAPYSPYAAPRYPMMRPNYAIVGAAGDPNAPPTFMDNAKAFLGAKNSIIPVQNGVILGAAVLLGGGYMAYEAGWFGRRRR